MLTNVISELVRTLSQPLMTSPGLLVLKKSSKSGLAVASITAPATDASLKAGLLNDISFVSSLLWEGALNGQNKKTFNLGAQELMSPTVY